MPLPSFTHFQKTFQDRGRERKEILKSKEELRRESLQLVTRSKIEATN
ncbi:hypothetical protein MtrunA17_Chr7g0229141 [Medicago truncatula]|uniref:Uncharacterized protein n=1 Tax=Medicago truncatula TaxID=3880 RepID=A0A396H0T4_MEDTR|nr:hypothetical protein MtrunA17_Chr7g0229141 [Medicago truncatula]